MAIGCVQGTIGVVPPKNIVHLVQQRLMEFLSLSSRPRILRAMREIRCLFQIIFETISDLKQAAGYIYTFLSALLSSRATLAARVLAAESQLAACKRRIEGKDRPRPRFAPAFRLLSVLLSKAWDQWHQVAHLMQPATVKRWHTTAFRLYWRRKSKGRAGRPPVPKEMCDLIRKLSRENPLWSAERIEDTLRLLGYDPPCSDTIRKYMSRPKTQPDKPATWLPFLRNHLDVSWAIDFFTVITVGFSFLYVFVVFEQGRRRVISRRRTTSPWPGSFNSFEKPRPSVVSPDTCSVTMMASTATECGSSWTAATLKRCERPTGVLGRILISKGFSAPYAESCSITLSCSVKGT